MPILHISLPTDHVELEWVDYCSRAAYEALVDTPLGREIGGVGLPLDGADGLRFDVQAWPVLRRELLTPSLLSRLGPRPAMRVDAARRLVEAGDLAVARLT